MASTKRLLKERANIARDPIPYVTFQEDDDGDEKMSDDAAGTSSSSSSDINQWRFVLALDPAHDALGDASDIGRADSPLQSTPVVVVVVARGSGGTPGEFRKSSTSDTAACGGGGGGGGGEEDCIGSCAAFQLDFPPNYPFKPPAIAVLGHPTTRTSRGTTGEMCDSVLTGRICMRLRKFLCEPDPDHPLEGIRAALRRPAYKHATEHATKAKAEDAMARGKQAK
ncbi:hypothetical protein ACHAW5_002189 [Stephanodiscus triporus]|uniref:UBC core domain-containing protein n=1 Tax=Stephanodiscus triporus TaxID=2934178 RepID=A0ABD3NHC5_9STRA